MQPIRISCRTFLAASAFASLENRCDRFQPVGSTIHKHPVTSLFV